MCITVEGHHKVALWTPYTSTRTHTHAHMRTHTHTHMHTQVCVYFTISCVMKKDLLCELFLWSEGRGLHLRDILT